MSTQLVKIDASKVPPTHQSTELLMGCKKNYVTQIIEGRRNPGGVESRRGQEIHHTMSLYLSHCARKGVAMDLSAFDEFAKGAGAVASKILVGVRDSYEVDFAALFATELRMSLDEEFQPTDLSPELDGICEDSGNDAGYVGTLDGLNLYREENRIVIDDFKSHPRPYNPSDLDKSMQGKEYSLFCFLHFPWVNEVKFRLIFVRFRQLVREVTYVREEVPALIEAVRSMRSRQKAIHEEYIAGKEIEATGNDGCVYCPLLSNRECPILQDNPNAQGDPSEWLSSALVYSAYAKVNSARMRAHVQGTGKAIILRDYNQKAYSFGPVESESNVYPLFQKTDGSIATRCLCGKIFPYVPEDGKCPKCGKGPVRPIMPIVEHIIDDYAYGNPGDTAWMGNLVISSTKLNSYLGSKKRVQLDQCCQDSADKVTKATLKVSKPLDSVPDEEPEEESGWDEDEEEF